MLLASMRFLGRPSTASVKAAASLPGPMPHDERHEDDDSPLGATRARHASHHGGERGEMRPIKAMISLEEALHALFSRAAEIQRTETLGLMDAAGRVLLKDIAAPHDVPPFDRAAMDGYAVRAQDTYGAKPQKPKTLRLVDAVDAGSVSEARVGEGECIQIATGAPMPEGADAVLMVEHTEPEGEGRIAVYGAVHPGENIGKKGEDVAAGRIVAHGGEVLTPAKIGVCAALGIARLEVYERPRVAVIPSGEEIVPPGEVLGPGKIHDVNTFTLGALLREAGAEPRAYGVMRDSKESIQATLEKALAECDLVVVSGGSSVGARDLMVNVVEEMGELLFHGIAVKPGKPTLAALVKGKLVLGMPGYPTSCLTNGYGILVPLVRKIGRMPAAEMHTIEGAMARRVLSTIGRHQYLPVRVERVGGRVVVHSVFKESGAITSMSEADGYIEIPANVDIVEKGEKVHVHLF
jgi:molybdenum cofactor synthesis domain-containing protein